MKPEDELESFALGIHGALAFGHALAALWNWRRGNYFQALFHVAISLFETWAAKQHEPKDKNEAT